LSILLIGLFGLSTAAAQPAGDRAAPEADSAASDREMPDGELPETMPSGQTSGEAVAAGETAAASGDGVPLPPHRAVGGAEQADEVGPPIYWLKDDDGELHAVPGMTIEDFWRAYEMIHRLDAPVRQPAFVLSRLRIEAHLAAQPVSGAIAPVMHLNVQVSLQFNRTGWVRVPLGLAGAVYGGDARLTGGDAPHYIAFEGDDGGYVLWINVQELGEHQLVLPLKLRTEETGSGGRCKFALPLAAQSDLRLSMPSDDMDVTLTGAAVESQQEDRQPKDTDDEPPDADDAGEGMVNGGSVLVYSGLGREIDVRWRRRDPAAEATPTVLEALDGTVLVSIDGQTITSESLLKVRSLGGPLERLYVRLPDHAELIPRPQPGYRVSVMADLASLPADLLTGDTAGKSPAPPGTSYAEVMLEKPTTEPIEIRLFTQRRHRVDDSVDVAANDVAAVDGDANDADATPAGTVAASLTAVDLGGFEVLGALRQSGYVAVGVVGDWQITWGPPRGVRQVPPIPAVLNRGQFVAGFEYVSQPFSLPLRVAARTSRIGVEPTYVVRVEPDGVHLEAQLKYAIRSANAFGVSVDMTGWTVEEIGPANVVDLDGVDTDATSPLFVPFLQSVLGEVTISVRARRELEDRLSFTLPRPVANTLGPAELVVLPADNVVVSPLAGELEGLRLETALPSGPLPPRQQEPLVYRAGLEPSRFVANADVMSGVVTADVQTELRLSADDVVIEQLLSYDAAYEAVGDVDLLVPIAEAPVVVTAGEEVLDLQNSPNQRSLPPGFARVVAVLPSPRIGEFHLIVRQRRWLEDLKRLAQRTGEDESTSGAGENREPTETQAAVASRAGEDGASRRGVGRDGGAGEVGDGKDGGGERIVVPLAMPTGVEIGSIRLSVATESGVQCDIMDQPTWDDRGLINGDGSGGVLTATAAPGKEAAARQIRLTLRRDSQLTRGGIRIERAWVRTRLNNRSQDVTAAYRFTTVADQLELVMPATWRPNGSAGGASEVEARLDGTPVAVLERERAISIAIDQTPPTDQSSAPDQMSTTDRAHVLELRFTLPPLDVGASRFTLRAPTFAAPVWIRRLYWEVDVPSGRRVLGGADGFVGEYQWQRSGLVWSRVSSLTSTDLATWLGVTLPTTETFTANRYLFSAIDPPAELEISAPRLSTIVLWASGVSLVAGLLLIHVPRLRHPGVFWVCGVAVVASSVMYLELAVLIAQASMIGLALVFLAAMLERFFSARRRGLPLRAAGSSLVVNRRASPARFAPLLAGKSDSTQTLPVATSESSHGSES
jgi:hypothetical protein